MKVNKIIVSSLSLVASVAVIGSISSSIAWFQYATVARAAYSGVTVNSTKLVSMSCDGGLSFANSFSMQEMKLHTIGGTKFIPITTGPQTKDGALSTFYAQPDYQQGAYSNWLLAKPENYATFSLFIKVDDVGEQTNPLTNDVYLTDLTIVDAASNGVNHDLSDAVRVHLKVEGLATKYYLFAKSDTSTSVGGNLDLNNDGAFDKVKGYEWEFENGIIPLCTYGSQDSTQQSYLSNDSSIIPIEVDGDLSNGSPIGTASSVALKVTVTIWLEGWSILNQGLEDNASGETSTPVWDNTQYAANTFYVGMEFGTKLYSDSDQTQF